MGLDRSYFLPLHPFLRWRIGKELAADAIGTCFLAGFMPVRVYDVQFFSQELSVAIEWRMAEHCTAEAQIEMRNADLPAHLLALIRRKSLHWLPGTLCRQFCRLETRKGFVLSKACAWQSTYRCFKETQISKRKRDAKRHHVNCIKEEDIFISNIEINLYWYLIGKGFPFWKYTESDSRLHRWRTFSKLPLNFLELALFNITVPSTFLFHFPFSQLS